MGIGEFIVNIWIISGRLTRDAEAITTTTGKVCLKFAVAQAEVSGGKKYTEFINCVWWPKSAEKLHSHLNKGKKITVQGHSRTEKWTDKTGQPRERVVMSVVSADFDFNKMDNNAADAERQARDIASQLGGEYQGANPGDEVPF